MGLAISSPAKSESVITARRETVKHEGITWQWLRTIQRHLNLSHEQPKSYFGECWAVLQSRHETE